MLIKQRYGTLYNLHKVQCLDDARYLCNINMGCMLWMISTNDRYKDESNVPGMVFIPGPFSVRVGGRS